MSTFAELSSFYLSFAWVEEALKDLYVLVERRVKKGGMLYSGFISSEIEVCTTHSNIILA